MAKSWADLSKEERDASGMTKKEYNKSTGYRSEVVAAEKATPAVSNSNQSPQESAAKQEQNSHLSSNTNSRSEAKERSQNYSYYKANEDGRGGTTYYGEEAHQQKAADDKARNERMHANKVAEFGEDLKGYSATTGKNIQGNTQNEQMRLDREESAYAYGQSRKDINAEKLKHGPAGVYGMQSAQGKYGTGKAYDGVGWYDDQTFDAFHKDNQLAALRRTFELSGSDFNYDEIQRSKNFGEFQGANMHLYDQYGEGREGYENWFNNYSIYGGENGMTRERLQQMEQQNLTVGGNYTYDLGNFKGSQDIMEFDKVMEVGRNQQNAIKDYQNSNEFLNKYGKYDWAQK